MGRPFRETSGVDVALREASGGRTSGLSGFLMAYFFGVEVE